MQWPFGGRVGRSITRDAADWHSEMQSPASAAQVADFEAWLRADPANLRTYRELDAIAELGGRLGAETAAAPVRTGSRRGLRPALALAILASVGFGSWWLVQEQSPGFTTIANRSSAVRLIAFREGAIVALDAGTTIEVASSEDGDAVRMAAGRARYAVRRLADRPLSVETRAGTVSAADSVFDVVAQGRALSVRVLAGNAAFADTGRDPNVRRSLRAGTLLRAGAERNASLPATADLDWPDARVSFDSVPLSQVMARANRTRTPKLMTADAAVANLQVTGVLDLRNNRVLARKLAAAFDLIVEPHGDALLMRR